MNAIAVGAAGEEADEANRVCARGNAGPRHTFLYMGTTEEQRASGSP